MAAPPGTDLICIIIPQTKAPALSGAFLFIEFDEDTSDCLFLRSLGPTSVRKVAPQWAPSHLALNAKAEHLDVAVAGFGPA